MTQDNQTLVSVIVPVYNRAGVVTQTLDSIHAQSYRPIELVVVDNASDDTSRTEVEAWASNHRSSDFRIIIGDEPTPGATSARNCGFRLSTGRYISFFDSDDYMKPEMISTAMAAFRSAKETELVVWPLESQMLDGSTRRTHVWPDRAMECHLVHCMLCTISYMCDRRLLERAGLWNPSLPAWNDWELGTRILLAHPATVYLPQSLSIHIQSAQSITGTDFHSRAGRWEKTLDAVEEDIRSHSSPDMRDRLLRIVDYRRAILAAIYRREGYPELGHPLLAKSRMNPTLGQKGKLAITMSYHWTARGLRGAWRLFGPLLK